MVELNTTSTTYMPSPHDNGLGCSSFKKEFMQSDLLASQSLSVPRMILSSFLLVPSFQPHSRPKEYALCCVMKRGDKKGKYAPKELQKLCR